MWERVQQFLSCPGVAGELVIAGECLARGYMNRADVTATKFRPIPDPNDLHNARAPPPPYAITGPRAYFTGDLCRYGSDGTIYYLGRIDSQVRRMDAARC
jgi:non-ribosomal peptide synthetase component F